MNLTFFRKQDLFKLSILIILINTGFVVKPENQYKTERYLKNPEPR